MAAKVDIYHTNVTETANSIGLLNSPSIPAGSQIFHRSGANFFLKPPTGTPGWDGNFVFFTNTDLEKALIDKADKEEAAKTARQKVKSRTGSNPHESKQTANAIGKVVVSPAATPEGVNQDSGLWDGMVFASKHGWGFVKGAAVEFVTTVWDTAKLLGTVGYNTSVPAWVASHYESTSGKQLPGWLPKFDRTAAVATDTVEGLEAVIDDPSILWQDISQSWSQGDYGEALGTGTARLGMLVAGPEEWAAKAITTLSKTAKLASRVGRIEELSSKVVSDARKTGKWDGPVKGMREGGALDDFLAKATPDEIDMLERQGLISAEEAAKARAAKPEKPNGDGDRTKRDKDPEEVEADPQEPKKSGEPVIVTRGEYVENFPEFYLNGTIQLDLRRHYGHMRDTLGPLGRNRTCVFDQTFEVRNDNKLLFRDGEGRRIVFRRPFGFAASQNAKYRHLSLTAPWLKKLKLDDGQTVRSFEQGKDKIYRLVAIEDASGNTIVLERREDLLESAAHSDGFKLVFDNNGDGQRTAITLEEGGAQKRLVTYTYDTSGNMTQADCTASFTVTYTYDDAGRLMTWRDSTGRSRLELIYDDAGRVLKTETNGPFHNDCFSYDPATRRTHYRAGGGDTAERSDYDADENILAETDALGNEIRHSYAGHYRTATVDPLGHTTRYAWDIDGNLSELIDAEGRRTRLRWDGPGRLQAVSLAGAGDGWRFTRDDAGRVIEAIDPNGAITRHDWTTAGRLAATLRPDGTTERCEYDARHRLIAIIDAAGGVTRLRRDDPFGRVTSVIDPLGTRTTYAYSETNGAPFDTPAQVVRPDGVTLSRRFDSEGETVDVTDGEGRVTQYAYGPFDQLLSVTDPLGGKLSLTYDVRGDLVRIDNANGRRFTYERDAAGRVIAETDFDERTIRYERDVAGRVIRQTNGDGSCVTFAYDAAGLLTERCGYQPGEASDMHPPQTRERFSYDGAGRLLGADNEEATVRFTRDEAGRIVTEEVNGRVVEHGYDALGRRTERRIGGSLAAYAYDPLGALSELTLSGGGSDANAGLTEAIAFQRDALGRETGRIAGDFALRQVFDTAGQLTRQSVATRGAAPFERQYGWNKAFEPLSVSDPLWGGTRYSYDNNGQVSEARHGEGLPSPQDLAAGFFGLAGERVEIERFEYDAAHDVAASDTALAGEPEGRSLSPWLRSAGGKVRAARGPAGKRILLTHDDQGRVIERRVERNGFRPKVWRFGWNALDRLIWCDTPEGARWRYGSDPFGRRLWKRCDNARAQGQPVKGVGKVGGTRPAQHGEAYLWDGDVIAEAAPLYADGTPAWEAAVSWHYEPGGFRPLARQSAEGVHHVVTDPLGTPRELYDGTGERIWSRAHWLWGGTRARQIAGIAAKDDGDHEAGDALCPIGFPGQWQDAESGLCYNRHRVYDPDAGQYLSPDPIGLEGGVRPQGYVDGPTAWMDPLGLAKCQVLQELDALQTQQGPDSHFLDRHGAQTTLKDQQIRAQTGFTPDKKVGKPVPSSRFYTHSDQLDAAKRAIAMYKQNPQGRIDIPMGRPMGEGYLKGGTQYFTSDTVRAYFDPSGNLMTIFPLK
ncbi:hypothetical protein GAO09_26595 [Rhizobiales bacterium RZME27]|uniref:Type IV secretion protein Rhs n=1 Tax=Endobacterium cereale TaxID=2663029 RepID=A0A6A8AER7_9HYPH|nr:RHS repeat-associated core domain-containing protein [Endobacterium cereale]MQY49602.1 hypothetical protein [Endobacterium cereale]